MVCCGDDSVKQIQKGSSSGYGAVPYCHDFILSLPDCSVHSDTSGNWPPRFWKLHCKLSDGTRVAFTDARRFARVRPQQDPLSEEPVSKLGFDCLTELPDLERFKGLLNKRGSAKIKALLLNQVGFGWRVQE